MASCRARRSGGGKSLAATALIFAIQRYRPVPSFSDEVAAALDDTNIRFFNRLVKEPGGNSRSLLITHNCPRSCTAHPT
jgi:chromosome segregation protein